MKHYDFVQNCECEFFPCHSGIKRDDFSCLFCFCPLYALGDKCGGNFTYTSKGIKDCSTCIKPHLRSNYNKIMAHMGDVLELAKKKTNECV